jgi:hypothetical protein
LLQAADGGLLDQFGLTLALFGDEMWVGSPQDDDAAFDAGAVYVYRKSPTGWVQAQKLHASDASSNHFFGSAIAVSADWGVIGAPGNRAAYFFEKQGTQWLEQQKVVAPPAFLSAFGSALDLDGSAAVIGDSLAPLGSFVAGAAYIYRLHGSQWNAEATHYASDAAPGDGFATSLALCGDVLVSGNPWDDDHGASSGSAWVLRYDGSQWNEEQKLTDASGAAEDFMGRALAIEGDVIAVAVVGDDLPSLGQSGSVLVYRYSGTSWVEEQKLLASDAGLSAQLGTALEVHGSLLAAGAPLIDGGSVYLYYHDGTSWHEQRKLVASDPAQGLWFGDALALDATTLVVGDPRHDGLGSDAGAVYSFPGTEIGLDVRPRQPSVGEAVQITVCGGNGQRALLFVVAQNDIPWFRHLGGASLSQGGGWLSGGTVPDVATLPGSSLTLRAFVLTPQDTCLSSNQVRVEFR